MLEVDDGHTLYVHDWGKKDAKNPIVVLHGGPGGGFKGKHKERYDPTKQRVIFHDQRGSGRSTPNGSLTNNTTDDLVEDIEKIADKLGLEQFILAGGSWGSTLALAYVLKYPKRVKSMILQGVYTGSQQETDYLAKGMYRTHFPEVWEQYLANTPKAHHEDPSAYHFERILGNDPEAAFESALAFSQMDGSIMSIDDRINPIKPEEFDITCTKIEAQYFTNGCFLPDDRYILNNAHNITTPTWIVQGRFDFSCPPITAYELSQKMPNAELIWTQAGHANDRSNYEVMCTLLLQASLAA